MQLDTKKKAKERGFVAGYFAALATLVNGKGIGCHQEIAAIGIYTIRDAIRAGADPADARTLKGEMAFARSMRSAA